MRLGEGSCRSPPFTVSTTKGREACCFAPPCGSWPACGLEGAGAHGLMHRPSATLCGTPAAGAEKRSALGSSPTAPGRSPTGLQGAALWSTPAPLAGSFWRPRWGRRPAPSEGCPFCQGGTHQGVWGVTVFVFL